MGASNLAAALLLLLCLTTVFGLEFDFQQFGTFEESDSLQQSSQSDISSQSIQFVETDVMLSVSEGDVNNTVAAPSAVAPFAASAHFATLTPHLTYDEAAQHCRNTNANWTLCPAAALCVNSVPLDGIQPRRSMTPVLDGKNQWMALSADNTCQVKDGKTWGQTSVFKQYKGLVACCNQKGVVKRAVLSRWEGFLIRASSSNRVYMVENGVRRRIPNGRTFEALGFHWPRIRVLPDEEVRAIKRGKDFDDLSTKSKDTDLYDHPLLGYNHDGGNPFELFEGYLIKKSGSATICMVAFGSARCLPDAATFEALGFEYKFVQTIDTWMFDNFPRAKPFASMLGAAPNSEPYVHPLLGKGHYGASNAQTTDVRVDAFIESSVRRVLEREVNSKERRAFLSLLGKKGSTGNVAEMVRLLFLSNSFQSRAVYPLIINALYTRLLERAPTAEEQQKLLQHFRRVQISGDVTKNVKQLVRVICNSQEFQSKYLTKSELSTSHAIKNLYRILLGRAAESEQVVAGYVSRIGNEKLGWGAVVDIFLDSSEYKSNIGLYGVPNAADLYSPLVQKVYKKLLNASPSVMSASTVASEASDISKEGYNAWLSELLRRKEFLVDVLSAKGNAFLDENDRIITLPSEDVAKKIAGANNAAMNVDE